MVLLGIRNKHKRSRINESATYYTGIICTHTNFDQEKNEIEQYNICSDLNNILTLWDRYRWIGQDCV